MTTYIIYILECHNGSYYTGYTTDIQRRYAEHVSGRSKCKYTIANPPKKIAAYWKLHISLSQALRIEHAIKKLTKQQKASLIVNNSIDLILNQLDMV